MSTIVTRSGKGSPLTHAEVDSNFTNLNTDKLQNVVEDTTPQLGGTLDANGNSIDMGTYSITDAKVGQWDTAYGWGDHASAGYLTSYTETDPVYTASSWYTTTNNSTNWDTAYGWGNHASAGYATYPSQTGNAGKYLTTDGSTVSWDTVTVSADPAGTAVAMAIALG